MFRCPSPRTGAALALACAVLFSTGGEARAGFSISVNGTLVATDNGFGDNNLTAGVIDYSNTFNGYQLEFNTRTTLSTPTIADITSSQLLIRNVSGTAPLTITITEDAFTAPVGALGASNLQSSFTRNLSAGLGTSGTTSMTSTATSASGGGTATTSAITFSGPLGADATSTTFNRTSALYSLTTTVTVTGLLGNDAMQLTADSAVSGGQVPLSAVPVPGSVVMLLSGLPVLLFGRRRLRAARA